MTVLPSPVYPWVSTPETININGVTYKQIGSSHEVESLQSANNTIEKIGIKLLIKHYDKLATSQPYVLYAEENLKKILFSPIKTDAGLTVNIKDSGLGGYYEFIVSSEDGFRYYKKLHVSGSLADIDVSLVEELLKIKQLSQTTWNEEIKKAGYKDLTPHVLVSSKKVYNGQRLVITAKTPENTFETHPEEINKEEASLIVRKLNKLPLPDFVAATKIKPIFHKVKHRHGIFSKHKHIHNSSHNSEVMQPRR